MLARDEPYRQALLANLQVGATNSLRLRLELLIGHTLLYGLGKQAAGETHSLLLRPFGLNRN